MLFGDFPKVGYKVGYKAVYNAPGWCIVGVPKHHKETGIMRRHALFAQPVTVAFSPRSVVAIDVNSAGKTTIRLENGTLICVEESVTDTCIKIGRAELGTAS